MGYKIEFGYKEKTKRSTRYHFTLIQGEETCEHRIYFFALSSSGYISGYALDNPIISDPSDYIILGSAIIAEKKFMEGEIKKHFRD